MCALYFHAFVLICYTNNKTSSQSDGCFSRRSMYSHTSNNYNTSQKWRRTQHSGLESIETPPNGPLRRRFSAVPYSASNNMVPTMISLYVWTNVFSTHSQKSRIYLNNLNDFQNTLNFPYKDINLL